MASEMAQEFARKHLETMLTVGAIRLMSNLDESLKEVREVLDALSTHAPNCWCLLAPCQKKNANEHSVNCRRTRALMSRLSIEAGEK